MANQNHVKIIRKKKEATQIPEAIVSVPDGILWVWKFINRSAVLFFAFCFIFNITHRWLDLSVHKGITTTESGKNSALNASPMPPAWRLPELESSRSGVQGNLRFAGTMSRGKQLLFATIALSAASWIRYSQHGGGPTSLSCFPWHSCLRNPPLGVTNPQLTTS